MVAFSPRVPPLCFLDVNCGVIGRAHHGSLFLLLTLSFGLSVVMCQKWVSGGLALARTRMCTVSGRSFVTFWERWRVIVCVVSFCLNNLPDASVVAACCLMCNVVPCVV